MFGQQFLHHAPGVGLLVVADAGAEHFDAGRFGEGALVAADALAVGRCRRRALDDDDLALAAHVVEQIARLAIADLEIVGADIGDEAAGERIGNQHHRDFGVVELLHGIDHGEVVDRNEDDGIRPVLDHLIHHRFLLGDIVRLLRYVVHDLRAGGARDLVGGDAEGFVGRVGQVLGEHRDGHVAVGCMRAGGAQDHDAGYYCRH
nr:hypothetical protein [Bradyrhizobium lablabi]